MILLQSMIVFVHMCVIPYLIGCLVHGIKVRDSRLGIAYVTASGLMVSYALYEILVLLLGKFGKGFRQVSKVYLAAVIVLALIGAICLVVSWRKYPKKRAVSFWSAKPDGYMIAAFVIIVIQIGAILFMATPDKDDAFYSGLSSMSLSYDYLLEYNAYSGPMTSAISKRYVISALPVYQATLSLFSGMHHLVIIHNLFPLFYMPLAYGLFYRIGKKFLEKEGIAGQQGKFLFAFSFLHLIGNYFVFSPENFLVTRIWQGKALFVSIAVPMLWMSTQAALFSKKKIRNWFLVACTLFVCVFMGETGMFLGPFMILCQTLAACLLKKEWKSILWAVMCCVPEGVLCLIYLM